MNWRAVDVHHTVMNQVGICTHFTLGETAFLRCSIHFYAFSEKVIIMTLNFFICLPRWVEAQTPSSWACMAVLGATGSESRHTARLRLPPFQRWQNKQQLVVIRSGCEAQSVALPLLARNIMGNVRLSELIGHRAQAWVFRAGHDCTYLHKYSYSQHSRDSSYFTDSKEK